MNESVLNKLHKFFSGFQELYFRNNECIISSEEDNNPWIYFLETGYVKQSRLNEDGKEILLNIFKPYSFFPVILALSNMKNCYDFTAITPVKAYKAPNEKVIAFLKKNPDVLYDLTARLGKGIVALLSTIESVINLPAQSRILMYLLTLSKRFGKHDKENVVIELQLTHQAISNSIGLTRETVTRELKKMIKKQILSKTRKYYTIHDVKQVEEKMYY